MRLDLALSGDFPHKSNVLTSKYNSETMTPDLELHTRLLFSLGQIGSLG